MELEFFFSCNKFYEKNEKNFFFSSLWKHGFEIYSKINGFYVKSKLNALVTVLAGVVTTEGKAIKNGNKKKQLKFTKYKSYSGQILFLLLN